MFEASFLEHFGFDDEAGVAHGKFEHEAVELGFRERERPFVFDGILRGKHDKRLGHLVGQAVNGHLALRHGFEESRLGAGGGPVDFVGHEHLGEDGSGPELELAGLGVEDRNPVTSEAAGRGCTGSSGTSSRSRWRDCAPGRSWPRRGRLRAGRPPARTAARAVLTTPVLPKTTVSVLATMFLTTSLNSPMADPHSSAGGRPCVRQYGPLPAG